MCELVSLVVYLRPDEYACHAATATTTVCSVWLTTHSDPQRTLARPDRHARALHALNTTDSAPPQPAMAAAAAATAAVTVDGPSVAQWSALAAELRAIGGLASGAWLAAQAQAKPVTTWSWNQDVGVMTPPLAPADVPRAVFRYGTLDDYLHVSVFSLCVF
jgi:hypothetical protein